MSNSLLILLSLTGVALLASLVADRRKTWLGVKRGVRMFWNTLPMLLATLAIVSFLLAAVSPQTLSRALGGGGVWPFIAALLVGSVALIPGFVAYPLAAVLRSNGASTAVLAAFITTLMMVGIMTLPLEAKFFGRRVALIRNGLAFLGAVVIAIVMTVVLS